MGNKLCCASNEQTKPGFDDIIIGPSVIDTIQNYFKSHPTIKEVVDYNEHGELKVLRNKTDLLRKSKQIILGTATFIGEPLNQGKRQGYGVMLDDNYYYQGEWMNDMKNGIGLHVDDDGSYYYGFWKNDLAEGQGRHYDKSSKNLYEGQWKDGVRNGKGVEKYQDGSVFEGDFLMGVKTGRGKLTYSNGTEYEGQFRDDVIEGSGTFKGKNHTYEGQWKCGKMHGAGKSEWKNQNNQIIAIYIGQYKNGIKEGFGEYTDSKGVTYKAIWTDGQINQKGPIVTQNLRSSVVESYNRTNSN